MKSFESGSSPEQLKSEEEIASELPEGKENELELKPEKFLTQERGVLQRFKGRAKQVAGALLFVSALSVAPGMASELYTQETKRNIKIEQAQKQTEGRKTIDVGGGRIVDVETGRIISVEGNKGVEVKKDEAPIKKQTAIIQEKREEKINKANLTESSRWSQGFIESAHADMKKIKTAEDAEWLVRTYFNQFVSEYYMPTKGNLKEGPYGIKIRNYTEDDSKLLLRNAQEMKRIIQDLNAKFGIQAYEKRIEQIDDMIIKLERQSSYSGQKQKEALERMEKSLQQR